MQFHAINEQSQYLHKQDEIIDTQTQRMKSTLDGLSPLLNLFVCNVIVHFHSEFYK